MKVYEKKFGHLDSFDYENFLAEVHMLSGGKSSVLSKGLLPHIKSYVISKWSNQH